MLFKNKALLQYRASMYKLVRPLIVIGIVNVLDCVQARFGANCTVPGWFALRAFKSSRGKQTRADHHGTLSVHFAPDFCVRCVAYQWGTVWVCIQALIMARYGSLWHALNHIEKWSTVARFQTSPALVMVHFEAFKRPSGATTEV